MRMQPSIWLQAAPGRTLQPDSCLRGCTCRHQGWGATTAATQAAQRGDTHTKHRCHCWPGRATTGHDTAAGRCTGYRAAHTPDTPDALVHHVNHQTMGELPEKAPPAGSSTGSLRPPAAAAAAGNRLPYAAVLQARYLCYLQHRQANKLQPLQVKQPVHKCRPQA